MWRQLPENLRQKNTPAIQKGKGMPRGLQIAIATALYISFLFSLSYLTGGLQESKGSLKLQSASWPAIIAVFLSTVIFMYFLLIRSKKRPVIFICYDCQEAFHAQEVCPACKSLHVSDIRDAEWIEDEEN